jgi:hypothetical protein
MRYGEEIRTDEMLSRHRRGGGSSSRWSVEFERTRSRKG